MAGLGCIAKTLAMGLATDFAIGQAFGIFAGLFTGAEEAAPPPPPPAKPACAVSHQIKHKSFWAALAGVVVGAVLAAAVSAAAIAVTCATGGAAVAVGIGAVLVAGPLIGKASAAVTDFIDGMFPAADGPVLTGSANVKVGGLLAARAGQDTVACVKHSTPPLIAEGSETVTINGMPAARIDDKTACGAALKQGVETVLIGGPARPMVDIANEFSLLERAVLIGVEFLIPPSKCLTQGLRKLPQTLLKGKNAIKTAFNGIKSMVLKGAEKGPQLFKAAANAVKKGWSKFKGALKGILSGTCGKKCKPDKRKDSGGPGKQQKNPKCENGCPVDAASGAVVETRLDFEVGHTFPFQFVRVYDGQRDDEGMLGRGWLDSLGEHLRLAFGGDRVELHSVTGEVVPFDIAVDTDRVFNRHFPHFTLMRAPGGFAVHDLRDDRTHRFEVIGDRGRLARIEDAHGNGVDLTYTADGLSGVRHSDGPALVIRRVRDDLARRDSITFERTDLGTPLILARYTVERGLLVEASSTTGYHLYYRHDDHGRMVLWSDSAKTWATYEYDGKGRCVRSRAAEGLYSIDLEYDDVRRITRVRDGKGCVRSFHFDDRSQLLRIVNELGGAEVFEYDRHGQLVAHIDPAGHAERHDYDAVSGMLIRSLDREGRATELFYDEELRVVAVLDAMGQTWRYERDGAGEIAAVIAPDGSSHEYRRDARGRVTRIARTGGAARTLEYDERGRLVMQTDWLGNAYHYMYDARDRLCQKRNPLGVSESLFYDPRDRLAAIRHADGSQCNFVYDSEHNLTEVVDENGHTEHTEFGAFDVQRATVDAEGRRYEFDHDVDHVCLSRVRAPDGREYQLQRDAAGRVVREVDYHGSITLYSYDAVGNLLERVNAVGQVVRHTHDKNGELVGVEADGLSTVIERDALGRLVRADNDVCKLAWEYDALGRVVQTIQDGDIIDYAYDEAGACVGRTLRGGLWQKVPHTTRYVHDAQGRLTALELAGERLDITRDALGQSTLHGSVLGYRLEQRFDARGGLAEQRVGHEVHRGYAYDAAGNLTAVRDARWGLTEYSHDRSDRVLGARRPSHGAETFRYNPVGLLAAAHRRVPGFDRDLDFHYDSMGRLQRTGDTEHHHDDAGRLVRKTVHRKGFRPQVWEFKWDSLDRLVEVRTPEGQLWRYGYDALGRRVRKYNPSTHESVHFTWDGDVLLREVVLNLRGPHHDQQVVRVVHWQHEPGTFVPLARVECGALEYVVTDHLGTPKELVTPAGEVTWRAHHAVWGGLLATGHPGKCPIRFQGQYEDPETGLHYNRFRYYDPATSLYLSPDPIRLLGGLQPVAYVHNPVDWIDPLGLAKNPALYDHVTYRGIKGGKPYTGYASAPSSLGLSPAEIVSRRYSGDFSDFGGAQPAVVYSGSGVTGKNTARGLEQWYYEKDVADHGGDKKMVANKQNPVGRRNRKKKIYKAAAVQHLGKCG